MTQDRAGERILQHLVSLARAQRADAPWRDRQFLERFDERLGLRRAAKARSLRRTGATLAFAVCAVAAVFSLVALRAEPLSYRVLGGAEAGGYIESRGDARVQFSDGTQLALAPGARARVEEVTSHGSRVELERGQATLNVVKKPEAAWFVEAGPYTVRVTGTAFDVRWIKEEQRFELDLHHGSVVVTGPTILGSVSLNAGQKLISLPNGPVTVGNAALAKTLTEPKAPPPSAAPAEPIAPPNQAVPAPEAAREPVTSSAPGWSRLVAQGKFQEVIDAARARGIKDVLASASLAELAALADAARYARNTDVARQALVSARRRFPGSKPARDAAFFLGGLEDGGPRASLEWYERYLAESPNGAYTSQALGRRLVLVYRERGSDAAIPLAKNYLDRFPKGPYASAARKILDRQHP